MSAWTIIAIAAGWLGFGLVLGILIGGAIALGARDDPDDNEEGR